MMMMMMMMMNKSLDFTTCQEAKVGCLPNQTILVPESADISLGQPVSHTGTRYVPV